AWRLAAADPAPGRGLLDGAGLRADGATGGARDRCRNRPRGRQGRALCEGSAAVRARAEHGSAGILAMLVGAATATPGAGALWQQSALMRETENELAYAQAKWLLRGAIDWAGVILLEDGRTSSVDHRGEPWAVPLADTRLNEGDGRAAAYLAGAIDDEQGKLNLRNLASDDQVNRQQLAALARLLGTLGIDEAMADAIAARLMSAQRAGNAPDPARAYIEDLLDVGLSQEAMERLRPFVTLLPEMTPLNVNTASAEVLAASVP